MATWRLQTSTSDQTGKDANPSHPPSHPIPIPVSARVARGIVPLLYLSTPPPAIIPLHQHSRIPILTERTAEVAIPRSTRRPAVAVRARVIERASMLTMSGRSKVEERRGKKRKSKVAAELYVAPVVCCSLSAHG
jgi:hypothetical protein